MWATAHQRDITLESVLKDLPIGRGGRTKCAGAALSERPERFENVNYHFRKLQFSPKAHDQQKKETHRRKQHQVRDFSRHSTTRKQYEAQSQQRISVSRIMIQFGRAMENLNGEKRYDNFEKGSPAGSEHLKNSAPPKRPTHSLDSTPVGDVRVAEPVRNIAVSWFWNRQIFRVVL